MQDLPTLPVAAALEAKAESLTDSYCRLCQTPGQPNSSTGSVCRSVAFQVPSPRSNRWIIRYPYLDLAATMFPFLSVLTSSMESLVAASKIYSVARPRNFVQ